MNTTIEHNEIFDLAYRFVTETSENIFLTGKAGTGKTTFLKYLKEHCSKNTVIAAPTGVAAINAGGVTLHSLFQLPFHPFLPTAYNKEELLKKIRYNKQRLQLLRKTELLIIDEISMVRCDVMDAIDTVLRSVRRNYHLPFGGVQLLCIGDLHQLPPVAQQQEWTLLQEYYASPFFFDSLAVKEQQPLLIQLEKIYRQKEASFVELLNNVRTNNMAHEDFDRLHERFIPGFRPDSGDGFITLTSHNNQANLINNSEIQRLHTDPFRFEAVIENEFPESMYPTDASLVLKEGAQVMFIKNDGPQKRYFNGKIGVVSQVEKEKVVVSCNGEEIEVFPETWENSRYTLNRADGKLEQEVIGVFSQYPLRLAWAITIHKSQGLTFERVMIDAAAAFSSGQVYVALSRCTSLQGIVLLSRIPASAIHSNGNVDKGYESLSHRGSLAERFEGARQIFTQELLEETFLFTEAADAIRMLRVAVESNKEKLNSDALQWADSLLKSFNETKGTGGKFIRQVNELMKAEAVIENNSALQIRISAAAGHFIPLFADWILQLKNHPLVTEHKEVSDNINPLLQEALKTIHTAKYLLDYCVQSFSVTAFLKHKLNLSLPEFNITCYAGGRKVAVSDVSNVELYDTLRRWRDMICEDYDLPVYLVATHAGIKDICTFLPRTKNELLLISGFGKAKTDKYGEEILEVVNDYCERNNITSNIEAKKANPKRERKPKSLVPKIRTGEVSLALYKEGKDIPGIAKERNLTVNTIESHLAAFVETGVLKIAEFMDSNTLERILSALQTKGEKTTGEFREVFPEISYGEIRMAEAALAFREKNIA
ncbi:MAG: helix-turn-helix domain-containing protein [Ferruginibacter sp.]